MGVFIPIQLLKLEHPVQDMANTENKIKTKKAINWNKLLTICILIHAFGIGHLYRKIFLPTGYLEGYCCTQVRNYCTIAGFRVLSIWVTVTLSTDWKQVFRLYSNCKKYFSSSNSWHLHKGFSDMCKQCNIGIFYSKRNMQE